MKRPLFAVCLVITCVIAICYWLYPPPLPDKVPVGAEEIIVYGRIDRKENRISYGKEQFILYLTDYSIYSNESIYPEEFWYSSESDYPDVCYAPDNAGPAGEFLQVNPTKKKKQIMCYTTSFSREPKVGSFILLRGKPEDFDRPSNPGEFDSRLYYATLGIDFCVKGAEVLWESVSYSHFKEGLWKLRRSWQARLDEVLEEGAASVMKTMLLGDKAALDKELKSLYQDGGIAHIFAISGLHISIIGMGLYKLLRRVGVPIPVSALLGAVFIFMYGVMTGTGVSTGRAIGMFLIRMFAEILGRGYDMLTALGVLLLLMISQQPLYVYHSGFLLSFLALFGIGLLRPALEHGTWEKTVKTRYREGVEKRVYALGMLVKENFLTGFAVTVTTLPVTFWFFYEIPVYGVLLNLVVLPLMPAVMYLGMGILLLPEGIWLRIPAIIIEAILSVFRWACEGSLQLPGQTFIHGIPKTWQIVVYGMLLVVVVWGSKRGKRGGGIPLKGRLAVLGIALAILCLKWPEGTRITFLDVGQGDSICVQTAGGSTYLVDCGSSSKSDVGKYVVALFLKAEGVSYLEAVIVTHPDGDHCNGLEGLLEEGYAGRIGMLVLPDIPRGSREEDYQELEELAFLYGIPVGYLSEGMVWQDDGVTFTCLHPGAGDNMVGEPEDKWDSNEYSIVLHVGTGAFSALLTGDVEGKGEEQLAKVLAVNGLDEVTVLKVAHHGSRYSTTEDFMQVLDAQVAVISCGEGNSYGHPHEELLERLRQEETVILTTPESGAVRIGIGGNGEIRVQCFGQ